RRRPAFFAREQFHLRKAPNFRLVNESIIRLMTTHDGRFRAWSRERGERLELRDGSDRRTAFAFLVRFCQRVAALFHGRFRPLGFWDHTTMVDWGHECRRVPAGRVTGGEMGGALGYGMEGWGASGTVRGNPQRCSLAAEPAGGPDDADAGLLPHQRG